MSKKESPTKQIRKIRENIKVDVKEAILLRYQHMMPYAKIAKQLNCSTNAVWKTLKPIEKLIRDPNAVEAYDQKRIQVLNGLELFLLEKMVEEDALKGTKTNQLAYAWKQIHDARRLAEGLSDSNVNFNIVGILEKGLRDSKKTKVIEADEIDNQEQEE